MRAVSIALPSFGLAAILGCSGQTEKPGEYQREAQLEDSHWPFDQGETVAAITTRQVLEDGLPVLMVIHYSDDHSWAFLCNATGEEADGRVIGMRGALSLDPNLRTIADLPPGWIAERRAVGEAWQRQ